jgi:hypothetical protein
MGGEKISPASELNPLAETWHYDSRGRLTIDKNQIPGLPVRIEISEQGKRLSLQADSQEKLRIEPFILPFFKLKELYYGRYNQSQILEAMRRENDRNDRGRALLKGETVDVGGMDCLVIKNRLLVDEFFQGLDPEVFKWLNYGLGADLLRLNIHPDHVDNIILDQSVSLKVGQAIRIDPLLRRGKCRLNIMSSDKIGRIVHGENAVTPEGFMPGQIITGTTTTVPSYMGFQDLSIFFSKEDDEIQFTANACQRAFDRNGAVSKKQSENIRVWYDGNWIVHPIGMPVKFSEAQGGGNILIIQHHLYPDEPNYEKCQDLGVFRLAVNSRQERVMEYLRSTDMGRLSGAAGRDGFEYSSFLEQIMKESERPAVQITQVEGGEPDNSPSAVLARLSNSLKFLNDPYNMIIKDQPERVNDQAGINTNPFVV